MGVQQSDAISLADVASARDRTGERYLQFLSRGSLSVGLYVLPAHADDLQQPHAEDEVYYVVSGRGRLLVDDRDHPVEPGSLVYVAKQVPHRFHDIEEDLSILVFFAPEHRS